MTEIIKIDKVLEFIIKCEKPPKRKATEIVNELPFDITTKESIEILDKLTKDGYVIREIQTDDIAYYFSSFEGRLFFQKGGYQSSLKEDQIRNRKNKLMAILTITNIIAILLLTFLNYKATDKANDNKDEISKLDSTINRLRKANDSLSNMIKLHTLNKK